ncbi:hypothetical protein IQ259_03570 [Fortiea sp. LEGE XX443]|uniref:hypothetical protein n=1 Tax=Fortiea sp. LEGE XX443 TaxID=1828611 RepID=UPI001882E191|nr:hypothetical protein [Fortiea sp. LEGE XX443]MBE9004129.1 hypothetical protein [Fortiea sp. LEGE XX443]
MNFTDGIFLTLINAIACLAFPKLLFAILAKRKSHQASATAPTSQKARVEITSFPYCTVYTLTGNEFCKFSPHFCSRCSSY